MPITLEERQLGLLFHPVKAGTKNPVRSTCLVWRAVAATDCLNDHTLAVTTKKEGKETASGRIVVSADGKSRTVTTHGTDSKGNKYTNTAVFDKQ